MINGISGSDKRYGDKEWLGFWGDDLEIKIKFNELTRINKISTRFYNANGQWIYAPKEIQFSAIVKEGKVFEKTEIESNSKTNVLYAGISSEP